MTPEPIWLQLDEVLAFHQMSIARFGGGDGLRDRGLLESALERPKNLLAYGDDPTVLDLAAAYSAGIVKNHPFVDGNKRTGFLAGIVFLELNGYRFQASEAEAAGAVIALAAGELDEAGFSAWLAETTSSEA